jgi:hypothetical protein
MVMKMVDKMHRKVQQVGAVVGSAGGLTTIGLVGMADDTPAKVMSGVGMVGLVVAAVATTPVVVKTAVIVSIGAFSTGFARGVMKAWKMQGAAVVG